MFVTLGKENIILCNDMEMNIDNENVLVLDDISKLDSYINSSEESFVIGGATIYKLLMKYCNKLYVTHIDEDFEGDVYFPDIDMNDWEIENEEIGVKNMDNPYSYRYVTYIRK